MTGKQLKNSILQWAIQGKLVPQDPNDEPASVLLEKIRAEKARLVKEGKIKKDKKESIIYRGDDNSYYEKFADGTTVCIDDKIPFDVPKGWEWCRVSQVIYPPKYGTSNKSLQSGNIPVLRMGNIQEGEIVYDKLVYSNNEEDNKKYNLINGDLLFNRTNSAELVGKTGIYRGQRPAIFAGYIILLRPIIIVSDYLNYAFGSSYVRSYCKDVKTIGVQQCNINADKISALLIPVPPLAEQQRIVEKLQEVLPIVEQYDSAQSKLDSLNSNINELLKKSILQEAIQGKLVPQDPNDEPASVLLQRIKDEKLRLVKEGKLKKKDVIDSTIFRGDDNKYYEQIGKDVTCIDDDIPFDIPDSWCWCRIGTLFAHNNGKQLNKGKATGKMMKYITTSNLYWDGFILDNLKMMPFEDNEIERCQAVKGDLLVCEGGDIGRSCIWTYDSPIMLQNHIHKLRAYYPLCTFFFYYIFWLYNMIGIIGGKGIGIQGFSSKALHNTLVPLPPIEEQERIVKTIELAFNEIKG